MKILKQFQVEIDFLSGGTDVTSVTCFKKTETPQQALALTMAMYSGKTPLCWRVGAVEASTGFVVWGDRRHNPIGASGYPRHNCSIVPMGRDVTRVTTPLLPPPLAVEWFKDLSIEASCELSTKEYNDDARS